MHTQGATLGGLESPARRVSAAPLMPLATSVSPVLSQQRAVAVMRYAFEAPRVLSQPLSYNVYRMCALAFHARE